MAIFVDTSGIVALLNEADVQHERARRVWAVAGARGEELITTSYVQLEAFSLLQRRLGIAGVGAFESSVVPVIRVEWVDESLHRAGVTAVLTEGRRQLSLVDCVSFGVMRRLGLQTVFAFDPHFEEQGFTCCRDVGARPKTGGAGFHPAQTGWKPVLPRSDAHLPAGLLGRSRLSAGGGRSRRLLRQRALPLQ